MNLEVKDSYFKEVVETVKGFGFDVYAPENLHKGTFRYGYVTDGVSILYFQIDDLEGLTWSIECVPSYETGSGLRINIPLTKEGILSGFGTPFGTRYRNFEHFKRANEKWGRIIKI